MTFPCRVTAESPALDRHLDAISPSVDEEAAAETRADQIITEWAEKRVGCAMGRLLRWECGDYLDTLDTVAEAQVEYGDPHQILRQIMLHCASLREPVSTMTDGERLTALLFRIERELTDACACAIDRQDALDAAYAEQA